MPAARRGVDEGPRILGYLAHAVEINTDGIGNTDGRTLLPHRIGGQS